MLPLAVFNFLEGFLAMKIDFIFIFLSLLLATFCMTTMPVIAQSSRQTSIKTSSLTKQYSSSSQTQSSSITIDAVSLQQPNWLNVKATANSRVEGQIIINGVVVKELEGDTTSVNLSPYLSRGKTKVEILGSYQPKSSSVKVEFIGPDTTIMQETGGNGLLKQILTISVI